MDGHHGKRRLDSADDAEGKRKSRGDLQSLGGPNYKRGCVPVREGPGFHVPSRQKVSRRLLFKPDDASSLPPASALANVDVTACANEQEQQTANGQLPTHCGFPGPSLSLTAEARMRRKAYIDARRPTGLSVVDRSYSSRSVPPQSVLPCVNDVDSLRLAPCIATEARRKRKASMLATKPPGATNASHKRPKRPNSQTASGGDDANLNLTSTSRHRQLEIYGCVPGVLSERSRIV